MGRTEIRGGQIKDESITEDDIKDGSIKAAELNAEAITGQTLHSGTVDDVNDMMLIYDASTTALRKIPVGDLAGGDGGTPTMLEDTDQDTRVEVEATADDDTIRFRTAGSERMVISSTGNVTMENNLQVNGSIVTTNDISFQDNNGTFPTNTAGFFWDLNNDEARIYAVQPQSDYIDLFFKLSDNTNNQNDRWIFWLDSYEGTSADSFPLTMTADNFYVFSPPSATSSQPDYGNAKMHIPSGTSSATTTTHKGRLFLDGDNTDDLYIRFQNNTENAYIFQDQSNSNAFKLESANDIAFNTNGANERMRINSAGDVTISNALIVSEIDASGDLTLDANGGQIFMKDNGITYLTFNVNGATDSIDAVGHLKLNASADVYLNAQQGDIFFQDNGTTRMRIEDTTGDVSIGMGDTGPVYRLDVHDNTSTFVMNIENDYTSAGADLLRMQVNILNPSSSSALIYIYDSSNTGIYAVQGNGSGGSTVTHLSQQVMIR